MDVSARFFGRSPGGEPPAASVFMEKLVPCYGLGIKSFLPVFPGTVCSKMLATGRFSTKKLVSEKKSSYY
jgi:hypothetical protein